MTNKKTGLNELKNRIAQIVREEIDLALNEDVNVHLDRVKDKDDFKAWLMRQYFNPAKHSGEIWYSDNVNEDNVLEYISDPSNHFPQSPKEIAELWRLKKSLGSSLELASKDLDKVKLDDEEDDKPEKKTAKYETGEATLKDIGKEMGGLTATMINKLVSGSYEKIQKLAGGENPFNMDEDDWLDVADVIMDARNEVANEFARKLKSHRGNIKAFLDDLAASSAFNKSDMKLINDREIEGLVLLSYEPSAEIVDILLNDIEKDNNIFKTYQTMVARKVFPVKRGRPKKQG